MGTKNRTAMSPKTEQAIERSHTQSPEKGPKENLPFGQREQNDLPGGHTFSDHNSKGNTRLRGKNLEYATRKYKG